MYPSVIRAAIAVFVLSLVLIVISDVLNLARASGSPPPSALLAAIVAVSAVYAALGYLMFRRKNWARVAWTGLYLFAMALVIASGSGTSSGDVAVLTIGWLQIITQGVIAVLVFLPSANRWFSQ
jgi:hypothetical protein